MINDNLKKIFENKQILVTGGTGTIGSNLVGELLKYNPKVVRIFSNDEHSTFELKEKLGDETNLRYLIGDIRDKARLELAAQGIDIIFHAAALKHVPLCEYNPFEAVKTNVIGTQNLIEVSLANNVEKVIGISTDKAVNPFNTMGATKLLSEKLIIAANFYKGYKKTIFSCVRFGNVLDSRGSLIPIIRTKIKNKEPIKLTDPEMTRFIITIKQATNLILKAVEIAKGGEIFILKMQSVYIKELIRAAIEVFTNQNNKNKFDYEIEQSKIRLGEKIHEDLISSGNVARVYETEDMLILIPHITMEKADEVQYDFPIAPIKDYNSSQGKLMKYDEIKDLLKNLEA